MILILAGVYITTHDSQRILSCPPNKPNKPIRQMSLRNKKFTKFEFIDQAKQKSTQGFSKVLSSKWPLILSKVISIWYLVVGWILGNIHPLYQNAYYPLPLLFAPPGIRAAHCTIGWVGFYCSVIQNLALCVGFGGVVGWPPTTATRTKYMQLTTRM